MGFISETNENYYENGDIGGYQFIPLSEIVNNFILMFTGEGKVIPKARRTEIQMHAKRAIQEFSYDVFRASKAQEIEVPPSLTMRLPQDYVNWTGVFKIDAQGVERPLVPIRTTSNPSAILQDTDYEYLYDGDGELTYAANSTTLTNLKESGSMAYGTPSTAADADDQMFNTRGARFGMDPEHANANGGFYIDLKTGLIHFTAGVTGQLVTLKYISDGLGYDADTVVHKFAEDAIYKYILYAIMSVTQGAQEYVIRRYSKQFAGAKRVAKIRLSNLNPQALTQVLRGKSKQIKI